MMSEPFKELIRKAYMTGYEDGYEDSRGEYGPDAWTAWLSFAIEHKLLNEVT